MFCQKFCKTVFFAIQILSFILQPIFSHLTTFCYVIRPFSFLSFSSLSAIPAQTGILCGWHCGLCLEQGTPASAGVTNVMKAAGVTW